MASTPNCSPVLREVRNLLTLTIKKVDEGVMMWGEPEEILYPNGSA